MRLMINKIIAFINDQNKIKECVSVEKLLNVHLFRKQVGFSSQAID